MPASEIYDPLRKKYVARTPEEVVRQQLITWLHEHCGVSLTRMESEWGFTYNRRRYRADVLVFDRSLQPLLLVECKAPDVPLDTAVVEQVLRYTRVLPVRYILVTNGRQTHLLQRQAEGGFDACTEIPAGWLDV